MKPANDGTKRQKGNRPMNEKSDEQLWRCTVCGQIGTVGRCCGRDTREPVGGTAGANEPKHTPGPWEATWFDAEKAWAVEQCGRGPFVALLNSEFDARLIAAAPEMLEALKYLLDLSEAGSRAFCKAHGVPYGDGPFAHKLARTAIAKATGKEAW